MFFGNINNFDYKIYPTAIQKALRFLQENDIEKLPFGRHEIQGSKIYAQVLDIQTEEIPKINPEVHRKFIDVQYLHSGIENIGFCIDIGSNKILHDYNEDKDILFYETAFGESFIGMQPSDFAIFFPNDIHRPGCIAGVSSRIKKVVVKIAVTEI